MSSWGEIERGERFFQLIRFLSRDALCAGTMVSWEIHRKALRRIDGIPIFVLTLCTIVYALCLGMCK